MSSVDGTVGIFYRSKNRINHGESTKNLDNFERQLAFNLFAIIS